MSIKLMLPVDLQETNEHMFSKKNVDKYIAMEIAQNPETNAKVLDGVQRLQDWLAQEHWEQKAARLAQLETTDLEGLVRAIFVEIAYCQNPELFTSVTAKLAGRLNYSEKREGIQTLAEIVSVLCLTDAFDITKASRGSSLMILSTIPLSERLLEYVRNTCYLPPMVCEPTTLETNMQSAYLTHNDSVVLGRGNAHDEDVCLDVINTQNRIPMKLNIDYLCTYEEEPKKDVTLQSIRDDKPYLSMDEAYREFVDRTTNWENFKKQSYKIYSLLARQGNQFYLTHKVDKRGRIYCQGYHVSTQGTAFKKSIVDFANEEVVEGVVA